MTAPRQVCCGILFLVVLTLATGAVAGTDNFAQGKLAYERGDFPLAEQQFAAGLDRELSAGAFQNLGNAYWQLGETAPAIICWERALRLDPYARAAENNLKFARETAQLESPDLTWCEIAAGWLPARWWAWLAMVSFWFAVALLMLPAVLRWRRAATPQALVALGLGVFLLTLPANYGVWTRARLGVVLAAETPLRYTPTAEAEPITKMSAGEPARVIRQRGKYLLIQTRRAEGWVERSRFGLIVQN